MANPVPRTLRVQVSVATTEPCVVKVQAWPESDPTAITQSPWIRTNDGSDSTNALNVAKFFMPSAVAADDARWGCKIYTGRLSVRPNDPVSAAFGTDGITRVIPARPHDGSPGNAGIAVGSCTQIHKPPPDPNRPIATAALIAGLPNLTEFIHLGDTSYVDTWTKYNQEYATLAWALREHIHQPDLASVYAQVPTRTVMDDHESGPDNSYAADCYQYAKQVFTDVAAGTTFDAATYDLLAPPTTTYDTWMMGDAQIWLCDNRLWRDTPGTKPQSFNGVAYTSQLGVTQRNWLKSTMAVSVAPVKIILLPRAFKESYAKQEQQEILDWITGFLSGTAHVTGTVIFRSGDMHAGVVLRLSATREIYEVQCCPLLNTTKHSTRGLDTWMLAWGYQGLFYDTGIAGASGPPGLATVKVFATVHINTTNQQARAATVSMVSETGSTLFSKVIPA